MLSQDTIARFWSFVSRGDPDDCWLWTGSLRNGYGQFSPGADLYRDRAAHRFSYILHHGAIPLGLFVCHDCDVRYPVGDTAYRRCVNPTHLFLGTQADNMRDWAQKGRSHSGDRSFARLHPERLLRGDKRSEAVRLGKLNHPESIACGERNGAYTHPELIRRGSASPLALVDETDILEIRQRYAAGGITYRTLAAEYGVAERTIGNIVKRVIWKHVP